MTIPLKRLNKHPLFGEVISYYSQDDAIQDGVLVLVGSIGKEQVVFTQNLFSQGYRDLEKRKELVERGIKLLKCPDPEDSPSMRLRVIEKGRIWVIWNARQGFTFLMPDDY